MNRRVVIADAGPLIGLGRIDELDVLRGLFGTVCVTEIVRDEVLSGGADRVGTVPFLQAIKDGWIKVLALPDSPWQPLNPGVDPGEASAIRASMTLRDGGDAVLLVIDDRAGRAEARRQGIALIGTAAVIGLAKSAGLILTARPVLERLTQAGYYIAPSIVVQVLDEVGE